MSTLNQTITAIAAGNNSAASAQFCAYDLAGGIITASTYAAAGILQNKPNTGEHATLVYEGESEYRAAAAVVKGAKLALTSSGWFTTAASGGLAFGKALVAVASGGIGRGLFNFVTPSAVGSSA